MNTAEPSGNCTGIATFTPRQPAVFVDDEGKLQNASKEMLYSEQGDFEMTSTTPGSGIPKFSFSRKYIWRLQDDKMERPEISIWFVKPGTEQIDYLFHKFLVQNVTDTAADGSTASSVECSGGHLCVEDYYSSTYTFQLDGQAQQNLSDRAITAWNMHHEVQGPKKDQVIETDFSRVWKETWKCSPCQARR